MRNTRADNERRTGDTLDADAPRADIAVFRPATTELHSLRGPGRPFTTTLSSIAASLGGRQWLAAAFTCGWK